MDLGREGRSLADARQGRQAAKPPKSAKMAGALKILNRFLDQIVEEMERKPLERAPKRTGRKHRTNPVTMLKIVLYGAMERNYSSRPIEEACKRDMNYIWLLNGEPAPSGRAICRFRKVSPGTRGV